MRLQPAVEADYAEVVALANWAYRGTGPTASWNMEAEILEGQRLNESLIREDLEKKPGSVLLLWREESGRLLGTVFLEPKAEDVWYLGLFMVRPDEQKKRLGTELLEAAEEYASERGARRIRMSVLHVRTTLIGWYERRGYELNGETEPFPHGDDRFGKPLCDGLHFLILEKYISAPQFHD